ncbi:MAG TPA: response regulator [Polyangia bacterium]|jgi:DNA-binding response OmpR family regulator|nr:response regulator [Polyangia bacterium]
MSIILHTHRSITSLPLASTLDFATAKRQLTGHRALVMEEEPESFGRIFLSLSSAGCPATLARRWAQVEPIARRARPTLVLFSTQLAEMDGEEVVRHLRANPTTAGAILVAIAARESKKERRKLLELGCDGYVWKPADRYLFAMDLVARTPRLFQAHDA